VPSWSVNLYSLNLMVTDTPAFYSPGLGPQVAWDLTYNSVNPNTATDVGPFTYLFGPNVSCPYLAHVVDLGSVAHVVMPDGRTDWYYPINPGSNPVNYTPANGTGVFNVLTKNTSENVFTLTLADRSATYTFGRAFTSGGVNYFALTVVTDPYGHSLILGYGSGSVPQLLTLADANGNTSNVTYNANGQASQITDPFGGTVQFSYTSVGSQNLLSAITDQAGYTSTLGHDSSGRLISITTPLTAPDATWQFAYSGSGGQVASVTDPYGHARTYATTATTTTLTDQLGRQTVYNFSNNSFGGAGVITDALGHQTQQTFDANRDLTQVINARGYFSQYTYDGDGNRLTQTDYLNPYPNTSASVQRSWTYDANNNMLTATDPLGTQSWTYNSNNQPLTWTDKLGHTASYSYSSLGQLLTVKDRNGITAVTNTYGSTGRLATSADALGDTTQFQWDNRGRMSQVTDPAGNTTSFTYDLLNRVTVTTFPDQTTVQNAYNCCQLTQVTDQLGNITKYVHDDLGRLTQTTDSTGAVTNRAYDAVGNLTSLTDPNSHTWQWQYDALNRRTVQLDPLHDQDTWSYDAVGNVIQRVDGNNATTTYVYDALNRLTQTTYPNGSTVSLTYDAVGDRLTATNSLGQWTWTYNANSWVTSATTPMASTATQYHYDNEGHRTQLTDPDGNAITTGYDQAYRVASVGFPFGGQNQTVSYQCDPRGLVTQRTLPNGGVSTYAYDALGRMTSIQHAQSGGTTLFSFVYQYDGAGDPTEETSQRWNTGLGATVAYQADYTYDARYELTTEKYYQAGSFALELAYTYDRAGNRTQLVTTNPTSGNSPVTVASTYSADNQISQAVQTSPQAPTQTTTYSEDGNGSMTQAANSATGTTTYAYDFERRLTKVGLPAGTTVQFAYDPSSLRAQKTSTSGTVTDYVLDGFQALLEKNSAGVTQVRYVPGIARIAGSTISYYLEDRLGSVVGLANASQVVTDTFRYDAWGNLLQQQGTTNPTYQWVGEQGYYLNPDAGTYLLGLRHYAPGTGRFLTRDLIGFAGGVNLYTYVGSSPLSFADPSGLLPVFLLVTCGGCITALGIGGAFCVAATGSDVQAFFQCMQNYLEGLPFIHQCLAAAACALCIPAGLARGVKTLGAIPR
jgi:RHS repeat-associated protein